MQTSSELKARILKILSQSELPVPIDELVNGLLPELEPKFKAAARHSYSPRRTYENGQRVFHPADKFQEWFTVEVEDEETIIARFDDGRSVRLIQGQKDSRPRTAASSKHLKIVEDAINQTHGVVRHGNLLTLQSNLARFPWHNASDLKACLRYFALARRNGRTHRTKETLRLQAICKELGLRALYYVAPIANLQSILKKGILAHNLASKRRDDFSLPEIQEHRARIIPNRSIPFTLHDYVPLFFTPRPPLLYLFKEEPGRVARLLISPAVLLEPGAIFHDMNARSPKSTCYSDLRDLCKLHWDILHADFWNTAEDEEAKHLAKLYRQAEANIPLRVSAKYFRQIHVYEAGTEALVRNMVQEARLDIPVKCLADRFFLG